MGRDPLPAQLELRPGSQVDHAPAPAPRAGPGPPPATFLCPAHALVSDLLCMKCPLLQGIFCPSPAAPLCTSRVSQAGRGTPWHTSRSVPRPLADRPSQSPPYLWDTERCWPHTHPTISDSRPPPLEPGGVHTHLDPWEGRRAASLQPAWCGCLGSHLGFAEVGIDYTFF